MYLQDDDGDGDDDDSVTAEGVDVLRESESVTGQGSVTGESCLDDSLDVGSFGPDDVCFYGEVGCWKDSGVNSRMVNALEVRGRGGSTEMSTHDDENAEFRAAEMVVDDAETLEVPEEYDRCQVYRTEEELFGKVFQFPTERRPISY
ncbi:hypothetical protein L873DRAFT_77494, partial [Choiromyces venosus 120613-1]